MPRSPVGPFYSDTDSSESYQAGTDKRWTSAKPTLKVRISKKGLIA